MKLDSSVGCFIILLSILGGFLIAEPLLQATGLLMLLPVRVPDYEQQQVRGIFSFVSIVFSIVCVFFALRTILFFVFQSVEFFGRSSLSKPVPMVAMTSMICGAVCLVSVMWLEYHVAATCSPLPAIQAQIAHTQNGNPIIAFHTAAATHSSSQVLAQLFASLVFITGSSLIAFGIWSSTRTSSNYE
jgi:hypothetical protein